jgi:hypothetical protein
VEKTFGKEPRELILGLGIRSRVRMGGDEFDQLPLELRAKVLDQGGRDIDRGAIRERARDRE